MKINIVYISDKLKEFFPNTHARLTTLFDEENIEWKEVKGTKDIWIRDYMPIQATENMFVVYDYNPDYLKGFEGKYLTDSHKIIRNLPHLTNLIDSRIKLDGGNVVLTPFHWILTDKVFTENGVEKYDKVLIQHLKEVIGSDIIFLPWHCETTGKPWDDVYGHADGMVKWTGGKHILMSNHRDFHPEEADEIRHRLEIAGYQVTEMLFDVPNPNIELNWAYINYLKVGSKVIVPTFGIPEDRQALHYIGNAIPLCKVIPFRMRDVVRNGGALHCITWNVIQS
jgi:agmatine/peptidylarginine deiminase